jgi:hypothetical protein
MKMDDSPRSKASAALKSARDAKTAQKSTLAGASVVDRSLNFTIDPKEAEWLDKANTVTQKALDPFAATEQKPSDPKELKK